MGFDTAPLSFDTMLFTALIVFMCSTCGLIPYIAYRIERRLELLVVGTLSMFLLGGFLAVEYLVVPTAYDITPESIVIKRYIRDIRIDFRDITDIKETGVFQWQQTQGLNPGIFGFAGIFRTEHGLVTGYFTNTKYLVTITRTERRPFVISPDRPDLFVRKAQDSLNLAQ